MSKEELKKIINTGNRKEITAAVKKYFVAHYKFTKPSKEYLAAKKIFTS